MEKESKEKKLKEGTLSGLVDYSSPGSGISSYASSDLDVIAADHERKGEL